MTHRSRHGLHGLLLVTDAIGAAFACLALRRRRRWPVGVGLAVMAVMMVSPAAGPAGAVSLYTVAANRRWQLACLVAGAQVALLPLAHAIQPQSASLAVYYLTGTFGSAVVVAWGMFRRSRRQAQRERARRVEAQEQLRVEQVRYAERTRIAREMHDVLAHRISLLSLHAGVLEFRPDAPPEEEVPLPDLAAVPDAIGRHALRIVQEALTNARKHATAAPVELRLDGAPGHGLTIEVRNPTPALATAEPKIPGTGAGLLGLAERATLTGGRLDHGLDEHGHFRLHAWLPWPREAQ